MRLTTKYDDDVVFLLHPHASTLTMAAKHCFHGGAALLVANKRL